MIQQLRMFEIEKRKREGKKKIKLTNKIVFHEFKINHNAQGFFLFFFLRLYKHHHHHE